MLGWPLIWTESRHPPGVDPTMLAGLLEQAALIPVHGRIYRVVNVERFEGPTGSGWRAELHAVGVVRPLRLLLR